MLMSYLMQMRSEKGLGDMYANYGAGNGSEKKIVGVKLSPMLIRGQGSLQENSELCWEDRKMPWMVASR